MADELSRDAEFPRVIVSLKPIAPRGQRTQSGLSPGRRADVHDSRVSASQYRREIDNSAAQTLRQPRSILVTPIVDPLGLGPAVGRLRENDRIAGAIAQLVRHARRRSVFIPSSGQR